MNFTMVQRVLSGIVLTVFMIAVIVFDKIFPLALNIAVAVISVMAVHELAAALGLQNKWFLCLPSLAAAAIVPFCNEQFQFMTYCVYTLIIFSALIVCHRETTFKEVAGLFKGTKSKPWHVLCAYSGTGGVGGRCWGVFCRDTVRTA